MSDLMTPGLDLATTFRESPIFRDLDDGGRDSVAALCRLQAIPGGTLLCRQGTAGDALHILVAGRLRAERRQDDGERRFLGDIGRGQLVGEMALIADLPRSADVYAIRDSVVATLDRADFDRLIIEMPHLVKHIARMMLNRLLPAERGEKVAGAETMTLIPAGQGKLDLGAVAAALAEALRPFGEVAVLASDKVPLGGREAQSAWLSGVEMANRFVLYVADGDLSDWTKLCLRQADRVLAVGDGGERPAPGPIEAALDADANMRAARHLLLVHPADRAIPQGTRHWLAPRPALAGHTHVRMGRFADFERCARILVGTPQGLVLGGGGARGFAHIGAYKALAEAGYAVDIVGGTSIGAAFAALIAMDLAPDEIVARCRPFAEEKVDYTFPLVALSGGFGLAAATRKLFGDTAIEDLWLPFYCVTTDLTRARQAIHRHGPLTHWVRASCSLPGALPPVIDGESLHADGCILSNVPVQVMRETSDGPIVAIDIDEPVDLTTDLRVQEGISGWRLLLSWLRSRGKSPRIPHIGRLFHRALMSASQQAGEVNRTLADLYLTPPVEDCAVFDWHKGPRVMEAGYAYAKDRLSGWSWRRGQPVREG